MQEIFQFFFGGGVSPCGHELVARAGYAKSSSIKHISPANCTPSRSANALQMNTF
jgi:hypothetical protein